MKYTLKMLRASKNWSQLTASKAIGVSVDTWGTVSYTHLTLPTIYSV